MKDHQVEPLAWDSNFLGFPVARLVARSLSFQQLSALLRECRTAGIQLLYLMAAPSDAQTAKAAEEAGAWLADRKVTFALLPAQAAGLMHSLASQPAAATVSRTNTFTPQLESLAWQSGEFSRFKRDPNFEPHVFKNLYTEWLQASLSSHLARVNLTALSPTGLEMGLLTLGEAAESARIGLVAVDAAVRGQGVGKQLVQAAWEQAQTWGCTQLQVATQRLNERACRFYARCGFRLEHEEHIYHLWL